MIKILFLLIVGLFYFQEETLIFISGFCFGYLYFLFLLKTEINDSIEQINNSFFVEKNDCN